MRSRPRDRGEDSPGRWSWLRRNRLAVSRAAVTALMVVGVGGLAAAGLAWAEPSVPASEPVPSVTATGSGAAVAVSNLPASGLSPWLLVVVIPGVVLVLIGTATLIALRRFTPPPDANIEA